MTDASEQPPSVDLVLIDATLNRLGYPSAPVAGASELAVQLAGDDPRVGRPMAVRVVDAAGGAGVARLLTFSTSYPFQGGADSLDDLRLAAAEATQYLILGHFEVDDDGSLHLRHSTLFDSTTPPSDDILVQTVGLLDYQQLHFGDYLEQICAGQIGIELFAELVAAGEADD